MLTAQDIHSKTFEKGMRGYRIEEVDEFLTQVAQELGDMEKEKSEMEKKLYILAEKVDQYRNEEETLKTALLNAQRLGETVVYEAKQKAETIIYDATTKATQIKEDADERVTAKETTLAQLKIEVSNFKNEVLNLYKQHIEALSAVPGVVEEPREAKEEAIEEEPEEVMPQATEQAEVATEESPFASADVSAVDDEPASFDSYQGIRFED